MWDGKASQATADSYVCWVTKATDIQSKYVICITLSWQHC